MSRFQGKGVFCAFLSTGNSRPWQLHIHYRRRGQRLGWKCWRISSILGRLLFFSHFLTLFGRCPAVRGELLPRVGCHYWETVVAGCKAYRIGVAYQTEPQNSTVGDSSTSWCLHCVPTSIRFDPIIVVLHSCQRHTGLCFHHPHSTSLFTVTAVGSSCSMTTWNQTSLWRTFLLVSALCWTSRRAAWSSSMLRMASVWARSSKPSASSATPYLPWRDLVTWSLRWPWRSQSLPSTGSSDKDGILEDPSLFSWAFGSAVCQIACVCVPYVLASWKEIWNFVPRLVWCVSLCTWFTVIFYKGIIQHFSIYLRPTELGQERKTDRLELTIIFSVNLFIFYLKLTSNRSLRTSIIQIPNMISECHTKAVMDFFIGVLHWSNTLQSNSGSFSFLLCMRCFCTSDLTRNYWT